MPLYTPTTQWTAYTPTTQGFGTPTTVECFYKQIGDTLYITGNLTTGTVTASEARLGLPSGFTSNSTKVPSIRMAGTSISDTVDSGSGISTFFTLIEPAVTYVTFGYRSAAATPLTKQAGNGMIGSTTKLTFQAEIPI